MSRINGSGGSANAAYDEFAVAFGPPPAPPSPTLKKFPKVLLATQVEGLLTSLGYEQEYSRLWKRIRMDTIILPAYPCQDVPNRGMAGTACRYCAFSNPIYLHYVLEFKREILAALEDQLERVGRNEERIRRWEKMSGALHATANDQWQQQQ